MNQRSIILNIIISASAGLVFAFVISTSIYKNNLASTFDWVVTISLLALGFGAVYFFFLPNALKQFASVPLSIKVWGMTLAVASGMAGNIKFPSLIALIIGSILLVSAGLTSLHSLLIKKRAVRFVIAWALGGLLSFFALGFFKNFYPSFWELILITIAFNIIFTLVLDIILEHFINSLRNDSIEKIIPVILLTLGLSLLVLTIRLLAQYPTHFSTEFFLPIEGTIPVFLAMTILSQSWTAFILTKLDITNWRTAQFTNWMKRNLPGLVLASAISASTYLLATVLVSPDLGLADNYFDTDSPIWVNFLTANANELHGMRAVHPFVLMMLRPPVWLLSLLLNGDKFHAAILLNALVGGICVYLVWVFFKQRTGNTPYALSIAALLGFSNSHLLLSAFLESYIFSAAVLIATVVILQDKNTRLTTIVPVGLVTFGITITNFIQSAILFLLTQKSIQKTFKYFFITIALATLLSFVQNTIQPNSQPFYLAGNLGNETAFQRDIIDVPISETVSRANVISRTMTLFSVVAPRPLIFLEELGCSYPCFNTIRFFRGEYQYASYIGFGSLLARSWFVLLFLAALIFVWKLFKSPKDTSLQVALALNLIFNFILHMNYGDDPMLYSPNWTYAIVLFLGMSFESLGRRKWFNIILLVFLSVLLVNNVELFHTMMEAILPFRL
ncbi:MAG TPA: hypothetical protein DCX53_14435 [Anaerolineae bacterium]|nr:hypothetical protein [Anaerolineae bacterium]